MKKAKVSFVVFIALLIVWGCASTIKQPTVSQFRFDYNGENYRIRSIYSGNENELRNEIIGGRFMAVDYDKDKIIDSIILGNAELSEAQIVYDYALDMLSKENKLTQQDVRNGRFILENNDFHIEIKTFQIDNRETFNEFKVFEKRKVNPPVFAFQDTDADGNLDKVLKGECGTNEYQVMYSEAIDSGLEKGQLVKKDNMILVKNH